MVKFPPPLGTKPRLDATLQGAPWRQGKTSNKRGPVLRGRLQDSRPVAKRELSRSRDRSQGRASWRSDSREDEPGRSRVDPRPDADPLETFFQMRSKRSACPSDRQSVKSSASSSSHAAVPPENENTRDSSSRAAAPPENRNTRDHWTWAAEQAALNNPDPLADFHATRNDRDVFRASDVAVKEEVRSKEELRPKGHREAPSNNLAEMEERAAKLKAQLLEKFQINGATPRSSRSTSAGSTEDRETGTSENSALDQFFEERPVKEASPGSLVRAEPVEPEPSRDRDSRLRSRSASQRGNHMLRRRRKSESRSLSSKVVSHSYQERSRSRPRGIERFPSFTAQHDEREQQAWSKPAYSDRKENQFIITSKRSRHDKGPKMDLRGTISGNNGWGSGSKRTNGSKPIGRGPKLRGVLVGAAPEEAFAEITAEKQTVQNRLFQKKCAKDKVNGKIKMAFGKTARALRARLSTKDQEVLACEASAYRSNGMYSWAERKKQADLALVPAVTAQQTSNWKQRCQVQHGSCHVHKLRINMRKGDLGDVEVAQWCRWMSENMLDRNSRYEADTLDFAENEFGAAGARRLFDVLKEYNVTCKVLRLQWNKLDDQALKWISRYLTSFNRAPVTELHLSHNCITVQGAKWLLTCLAMHPAYPAWSEEDEQFVPLWLCLENNLFTEDESIHLLKSCHAELDISVCLANSRKCTARFCKHAVDKGKHNCVAHLCYLFQDKARVSNFLREPTAHARPFFAEPIERTPKLAWKATRQKPIILYEDDDLACVFKPPNWTCSMTNGLGAKLGRLSASKRRSRIESMLWERKSVSLHAWIILNFGVLPTCDKRTCFGLVHRLDRYTSGPLLIAKTTAAFSRCKQQLEAREVLKDYLCLVHGELRKAEGECHWKIDNSQYHKTKRATICETRGEPAVSIYQVIAHYAHPDPETREKYSLVHVRIVTGRTHQIRLHMSHMGHPLVGEELYIDDPSKWDRDRRITKRIFLHKVRIGFFNMKSEVVVRSCSLQMSDDLWDALSRLRRLDKHESSFQHHRGTGCGAPGLR